MVSHWDNVFGKKISLLAHNCSYVMSVGLEDENELRHLCVVQNKNNISVSKSRVPFTEQQVSLQRKVLDFACDKVKFRNVFCTNKIKRKLKVVHLVT
jgi:hypothetical protein